MKAVVDNDTTIRTIQVSVSEVPDLDVTRHWQTKTRFIRPDRVRIVVMDGETTSINVSGDVILKSGEPSKSTRDGLSWRVRSYYEADRITAAPEWVRLLWTEAPAGVDRWVGPIDDEPVR